MKRYSVNHTAPYNADAQKKHKKINDPAFDEEIRTIFKESITEAKSSLDKYRENLK